MTDEICGATKRDGSGEKCQLPAGWGTDHVGEGKCKHHDAPGGKREGAGAPEGNGNAEDYSLTSDPQKYYARQSDEDQDRIDDWAESWARRARYDLPGYDSILHETAVTLHQIHTADEYIAEEGFIVERVVGRTEGGEPIIEEDENPALLAKSRAMKDVIRTLKEFGCLDDPDSKQAEAEASKADALREYMQEVDG